MNKSFAVVIDNDGDVMWSVSEGLYEPMATTAETVLPEYTPRYDVKTIKIRFRNVTLPMLFDCDDTTIN